MAIWDIKEIYKKVRSNEIKGSRGFFSGGSDPGGASAAIDMINFVSSGNAVDFGDISIGTHQLGGGNAGSATRGFVRFGGENATGYYEAPCEVMNTRGGTGAISQDFGTLTVGASGKAVFSNQIRAVSGGGAISPNGDPQNVIDYFTIATYGNATDFGNLTVARSGSDGLASPTRGIFAGGFVSPNTMKNEIDYITIASTGDAADFGDLDVNRRISGTGTNRTRGIIAGGQVPGNTAQMDYITVATTGNSTDFGDLTTARQTQGVSNSIDLIFGGGSNTNVIDKMTIANLANAVDFGDLTKTFNSHLAASDGHGGLPEEISINLQRPSVTYMPGSGRTLFGGGYTPGNPYMTTIEIVHAFTLGNTSDFGELSVGRRSVSGTGSTTRGLFLSGSTPTYSDVIDSIEIASTGNAADFGNLSRATARGAALSSTTRGVFAGGQTGPSPYTRENEIEYVTIASAGNITDFGDLTSARSAFAGGSSAVRGFFAGGHTGSYTNIIDYITIASAADAADFGDLSAATYANTGAASGTRGLSVGGYAPGVVDVIDYITIASTGDASDFGDLLAVNRSLSGTGASTRGIFGGGYTPGIVNVIQYVTIASTGDSADFGDLSGVRGWVGVPSDSHGGLQN